MSFLSNILETTRKSVEARELDLSLDQLRVDLQPRSGGQRFLRALRRDDLGITLIAEFKRSAPSSGPERLDAAVDEYVRAYARNGASALSILTEDSQFCGSLQDLEAAREAVDQEEMDLPILRKDFVIKEYQVYEAVRAGADAILLIAAALEDDRLASLHGLAKGLGLDVLVEIRDQNELRRALDIDAALIGINNRNLDTFDVDVNTTRKLVPKIPGHVTVVSESGLKTRSDLNSLANIGVHAVLIGSALMRAKDTAAKCRELTLASPSVDAHQLSSQPALA